MRNVISNTFTVTATVEGKDAYILDLTNQMNTIAVDANGKVTYATTLTTVARIIKGADYVREDIGLPTAESLKIGNITPTVINSGGLVTIEWNLPAGIILSSERYVKVVKLVHDGKTYSADYVLRTEKTAATYDLKPSLMEIPFVRDADYNLIPASQTIRCGYIKNQSGTITSYAGTTSAQVFNIDGKYSIFYRYIKNDGTATEWGWMKDLSNFVLSISRDINHSAVEFALSFAITYSDVGDSNIIDRETVPIVKQSERGFGIVTSVTRNNFTEAQWNENPGYGVTGHPETWSDTSSLRNNARVGDLFTVVGQATDTGNAHNAIYRCTNSSDNLAGVCIGHTISKAGESPFIVDLSNEADLIGTDTNGKTTENQIRSTKLKMYVGSKQQTLTSNPTVVLTYATSGSKVPESIAKATALTGKDTTEGSVSITIYSGQVVTDAIYADITATCSAGSKTARFTLKALKSGEAGVSPAIYQLLLSQTDASFTRNSNNELTPAYIDVNCGYTKTQGGKVETFPGSNVNNTYTDGGAPYNILYRGIRADGTFNSWGWMKDLIVNNAKGILRIQRDITFTAYEFVLTSATGVNSVNDSNIIDRETVPITKDGAHGADGTPGNDGTGIDSISYHRCCTLAFAAPSSNDSAWISETSTLYPTEKDLSAEKRYLWQKKTTSYTNGMAATDEITLIAQFDSGVQENLLEDTGFFSDGQMEAWDFKAEAGTIGTNAIGGHNSFGIAPDVSEEYTNLLMQKVYKYGDIQKLKANTWYTLSFYAAMVSYQELYYQSDSNADYNGNGTSQYTTLENAVADIWLAAGQTIELTFRGRCYSSSVYLRMFAWATNGTNWSDTKSVDITSTSWQTATLRVTNTATYGRVFHIKGWVYLSGGTTQNTSSSVSNRCYCSFIRANRGGKLDTFLYRSDNGQGVQASPSAPWLINGLEVKSRQTISDGTEVSFGDDGHVRWQLSAGAKRYSVTFKTPTSLSSYEEYRVLFRMGEYSQKGWISMPKLEENTIATEWIEHFNDRMADDFQHVYVGIWSAGTKYLYANGVRHVVRAKNSASGNMTFFRMKKRTTAAGYSSSLQPYNDTAHWEQADYLKFVATELLLAEEVITDKLTVTKIHSANDKFIVDAEGNVTAQGGTYTNITAVNITANSGEIGGFSLSSNGLTNISTESGNTNMSYVICRNDYFGRFAGIGANILPASSGTAAVARFENTDQHGWASENIAMLLKARGKSEWSGMTKNIACATQGGCFSGFALNTRIIDSGNTAQSVTLSESDNVVTVIGTNEVNIYFPTVYRYDDGHVLIFKRDCNCTIKLHPGYYYDDNNNLRQTFLRYDRGSVLGGRLNSIPMESWGDSMMFIFHSNLQVTKDNTTYYGSWIQYKLPRDW